MRVTVVAKKDLDMKDWRAEHYVPATREVLCVAAIAGWEDGASGHGLNPHNQWLCHGREEVRKAYLEGRARGVQARAEFYVKLGGGG